MRENTALKERRGAWLTEASSVVSVNVLAFPLVSLCQVFLEKDKQWIVNVADEKLAVWKLEPLKGQKKASLEASGMQTFQVKIDLLTCLFLYVNHS